MNYKNTHIRTLATLLAFASVILAPAATAAGSSENSDKTNQATEQTSTQTQIPLQQRKARSAVYAEYWLQQSKKLNPYIDSRFHWARAYEAVASPAIKKYGTDVEKKTADVISMDIKRIMKEDAAAVDKINKFADIRDRMAARSRSAGTEKAFAEGMKAGDDMVNVFNTESANMFQSGKTLEQYHLQVTEIVNRIVEELRKNPKTQSAADKLDLGWQNASFVNIKAPITVKMFDPTNPMQPSSATPQGGGKQVRVRKVNQ